MRMFWIVSSFIVIGYGQDVSFEYTDSCYTVGDTLTMSAVYYGSGTVTGVQWYYSGTSESNLFIAASTCTVFGQVPFGYPDASRMVFLCPATASLLTNTFRLSLYGLQMNEIKNIWGATFSLSNGASPTIVQKRISECLTEGHRKAMSAEYTQSRSLFADNVIMSTVSSGGETYTRPWHIHIYIFTNLVIAYGTWFNIKSAYGQDK